jgi:Flp pilus assembly protein TadD
MPNQTLPAGPNERDARNHSLRALLVAGQNVQAIALGDQILADQPNSLDALHLTAIANARLARVQRSEELFERALMMAPEDPALHMNLAQLHLAKGDMVRAKEGYKAASMLDPNLSAAHASLGNIAAIGGDTAGANELFLTALRADPNALPALLGRGHLLLDRGELDEGLKVAQKAAKVAPQDAKAQALIGRALLNAGHTGFAIQAFQNAVSLKPGFYSARVMLARALVLNGDLSAAEAALTQAANDAGQADTALRLVRADLYAKTGRSALAARDLDSILSVGMNEAALRARVGLHFQAQELELGLALLDNAAVARPRDWLLNHALLGYLLEFGQTERARAACARWTQLAPDFAPAWMHLASIDEGQSLFDEARDSAERAHALDADLPQVALILARARLRAGRPGEAQLILSAMLAKNCSTEQRVDAMGLRGRAQDAAGQRAEAVTSWQEAAALKHSVSNAERATLPPLALKNAQSLPQVARLSGTQSPLPNIVFLTGLPMSGVESVAWWLAHAPNALVLNDRFAVRSDSTRQDFLNSVADDRLGLGFSESDLEHIRSRYLKTLRRAVQGPERLIIDWLPVLDARQYHVLKQALPEARWLHVEREARDALLGALMVGSNLLPLNTLVTAAERLNEHQQHLSAVANSHGPNDFRFHYDSAKSEQLRLTDWLNAMPEVQAPPAERWAKSVLSLGGLPAYFPAKRWQAFDAVLAAPFKLLA